MVAKEQGGEDERDGQDRYHEGERGPPADIFGERCKERQEDQLAGGVRRGHHADDEAATLVEPARRDGRAEHQCRHPGADPYDDAPQ